MKRNRLSGFTIAELLIVVAIIAVLVAVSIPVFTSQLEKSREATDLANVRAAYAEVMTAAITEDTSSSVYDSLSKKYTMKVDLKQKKNGWTTKTPLSIGGVTSEDSVHWRGTPKANGKCEVFYDTISSSVVINWGGYTLMKNYQWLDVGQGKREIQEKIYSDNWPLHSITEAISATNGTGMTLNTAGITSEQTALAQGKNDGYLYQIGYFILKPDGTQLYDSGRQTITDAEIKYDIQSAGLPAGEEVKIAVQIFKVKADAIDARSYEISDDEARELEQLISVSR